MCIGVVTSGELNHGGAESEKKGPGSNPGTSDRKKKKTITIKVPHISFGRKQGEEEKTTQKTRTKTVQTDIKKIPIQNDTIDKPAKENQTTGKVTRIKLAPIVQKANDPSLITQSELAKTLGTDKESRDLNYSKKFIKKFSLSRKADIEDYSYEKHGSLVDVDLPPDYEKVREYWAEPGRALVYIALNVKSRLKEYLLFEPTSLPLSMNC